jgi:hypothetical protein
VSFEVYAEKVVSTAVTRKKKSKEECYVVE